MADRLPPGIRHRFYTADIVVEYTTAAEDATSGVDAALPTGTVAERTLLLADATTAVGVLQDTLANLHPDNTEVAPAYVQKVALYAQYFLTQWLNVPYSLRDPRLPDVDTGIPPNRVEYRIIDLGNNNGSTRSDQPFIKIGPSLNDGELQDDVPHELMHRVHFLYNPLMKDALGDEAVGIYGVFREGGAVFCTECVNDTLNRYAIQCGNRLKNPQNFSLTTYDLAGDYGGAILWKYIAEQNAGTHPDGPSAAQFETYRILLEQTATLGPGAPGLGYSIQAVRNACLLMGVPRQWDQFVYLDAARTELDSHETTWGNYLVANYVHGSASPLADGRFDYLEDDDPILWFATPPPPLNVLAKRQDGVKTPDNEVAIGENESASRTAIVRRWSAWYYRIRPKLTAPPRVLDIEIVAAAGFAEPLFQILKLGPGKAIVDIFRSESTTYHKRVCLDGVDEIAVIVAGRDTGGEFELNVQEIPAASDVMCTRWNTLEGKEYEIDQRDKAWTWLSPDIMVGNDVVGNADGTVFADWDNDLRVRVRNKGNADANGLDIRAWCRLEPNGAWQPVMNSLGVVQERINETLAAGTEAWFDMVWAPAPLVATQDVWTLKVELVSDGDSNTDNKIAFARCVARPFIQPDPSAAQPSTGRCFNVLSFGAIPRLIFPKIPGPPEPLLEPIIGSGIEEEAQKIEQHRRISHAALPPGLDSSSLVTLTYLDRNGLRTGVTRGIRTRSSALADLLNEVAAVTGRTVRLNNFAGRYARRMRKQTMKTFAWQLISVLGIIVAGLSVLYLGTEDQPTRSQLVGYFGGLIPFVIGVVTGSAVAGATGFLKGRGVL
jgi:hypothetical protein